VKIMWHGKSIGNIYEERSHLKERAIALDAE
jgi:hypothetical protein